MSAASLPRAKTSSASMRFRWYGAYDSDSMSSVSSAFSSKALQSVARTKNEIEPREQGQLRTNKRID